MNQKLLRQQASEVMELIEDVVEYYCDDNIVSGEQIWCMIGALSDYKLDQFPLEFDNEEEDN
tara:strand:+ start:2383 stop:2568 length:186 start_codon:yes stop_codon:yes gene_type:complete